MNIKCFQLKVVDNRIGMAQKILHVFSQCLVNILAMEILHPYIQIKVDLGDNLWSEIKKRLLTEIIEILDIVEINVMQWEKKERQLSTIIDTLTEGILVFDSNETLEFMNTKAKKLMGIKNTLPSSSFHNIIPAKILTLSDISSEKENIEWTYNKDNIQKQLLIDAKIIVNDNDTKIGYLILLRDMGDVKRTLQTISRPSMVSFSDILCVDNIMKETIHYAKKIAQSDFNVLITGESGTGKELFARAIHYESFRSKGPFIAINCAAIPENLIESELFGYEKGAFTGANKNGKQGLFELANMGSIFLDEIGDFPLHLQAKLLRVVQEKIIRRIGGSSEISIDVRVISATHRNLSTMIQEKLFREDLFYRLQVLSIEIPPLRKRQGDIPLLAQYFMNLDINHHENNHLSFSQEALDKLSSYDWPGNIRELQNVIQRAVILSDGLIEPNHLLINNLYSFDNFSDRNMGKHPRDYPINLKNILGEIEDAYIHDASLQYHTSRQIAQALGISHTKVISRLKNK